MRAPNGLLNQADPEGSVTQCFAIAAVQVLLSVPRFRESLVQLTPFRDGLARSSNILQCLVKLTTALIARRNHQSMFQQFMTAACYSGVLHSRYLHGENDCAEFLFALLLHLVNQPEITDALLSNVFDTATQFRVSDSFQCSVCNHVWLAHRARSARFERHVVLPVALLKGKNKTLDSALLHTTFPHEIEHVCSNAACRQRTKVIKTAQYLSAPDILLIQIARPRGKQKTAYVNVSVRENLSVFKSNYVLRGVAMHKGATVNSGHYTALVSRDDDWFALDDNSCQAVAAEHELASAKFKSQVVLLAYERVAVSE
jgi:uncharacterized UBP type Zn finger protein